MRKKTFKKSIGIALAAVMTSASVCTVIPAAVAQTETEAVKYEFEDGKTNGGKIYTEGWKGNTEEDGSGEDYDLTNASGEDFLTSTRKALPSALTLLLKKPVYMNFLSATANQATLIKKFSISTLTA